LDVGDLALAVPAFLAVGDHRLHSAPSLVTIGVCSADAGEQTVIRAQESAQGCGDQLGLAVLWLACGAPNCLGELGVADGAGAGGDDGGFEPDGIPGRGPGNDHLQATFGVAA
jgi:hypothetical protein